MKKSERKTTNFNRTATLFDMAVVGDGEEVVVVVIVNIVADGFAFVAGKIKIKRNSHLFF